LDKTGTITAGQISVVSWVGDVSVKPLVAELESHSAHPIARAIIAACASDPFGASLLTPPEPPTEGLPSAQRLSRSASRVTDVVQTTPGRSAQRANLRRAASGVADVVQTTGGGLVGTVDGRRLAIGSSKFVRDQGSHVSDVLASAERDAIAAASTPVLVAVDGQCVAVLGLGDLIRPDMDAALAELQRFGWEPEILSGDHPAVVADVAHKLGVPADRALGGATPEDKVAHVERLAQSQRVLMVGDGVNDAAALSAATVGIAVHGGAEASLSAADVYLSRPGLAPIVDLMHAARSVVGTIHRSLIASLCYNAMAATLAMTGLIGPLLAAILMPISSFTVLTLAFTARTFGGRS
jgi:Cu2+-exporting ATPase